MFGSCPPRTSGNSLLCLSHSDAASDADGDEASWTKGSRSAGPRVCGRAPAVCGCQASTAIVTSGDASVVESVILLISEPSASRSVPDPGASTVGDDDASTGNRGAGSGETETWLACALFAGGGSAASSLSEATGCG